ncbi:isopentenyl phosphate kinase [Pectobacterium aquaticum]|uniref:isopentenyl phosphate kinase n=1 Tax=Pectobacterium aquaticum TaxID=2204145 RepID=UPI000E247EAA|nr:isopentenyl phosphate kinase [Pectobacterium aquaticum]RRO07662.1 hypothetical protein DMB81_009740 [Pectobacterium aquaticum]
MNKMEFENFHNETCQVFIVKIGGSISTNKDGEYELNYENIERIAQVIRGEKIWECCKLILVFGGGSFGNLAPKEYDLECRTLYSNNCHLSKMTTIMFSMLSEITDVLTRNKVPVYPFQCSALVNQLSSGEWNLQVDSIFSALSQGLIPVISGDLVFNNDGGFSIFSSDNIPELIAKKSIVEHVLYYSDVEGFYVDSSTNHIERHIVRNEIDSYMHLAGPSSRQDVTGGMRNKLLQIKKLLDLNISAELLSFNKFSDLSLSLNRKIRLGTYFAPGE